MEDYLKLAEALARATWRNPMSRCDKCRDEDERCAACLQEDLEWKAEQEFERRREGDLWA